MPKTRNLTLIIRLAKQVPQFVNGDSMKLKQILLNLTSNAIKFIDVGKVTIDLQGIETDKGQYPLRFIVKDPRIGIAEKNIDSVFNEFEQAED
ncbi:MAG: two-component system sensor histidine kinase/response regulator [Psychromonas sp.]